MNYHHRNKIDAENKQKNNNNIDVLRISSRIDVEGTLRAATSRYAQNPHAPPGPGKQWYDKLPSSEQKQIQIGIEALLYAGCMAAARRTFDTVVRQEMANANSLDSSSGNDLANDGYNDNCRDGVTHSNMVEDVKEPQPQKINRSLLVPSVFNKKGTGEGRENNGGGEGAMTNNCGSMPPPNNYYPLRHHIPYPQHHNHHQMNHNQRIFPSFGMGGGTPRPPERLSSALLHPHSRRNRYRSPS